MPLLSNFILVTILYIIKNKSFWNIYTFFLIFWKFTKYVTLKLFATNYVMKEKHMNTYSIFLEYPFWCPICSRRYKYKGNLMRHKKYECNQEPQFLCRVEGCHYSSKIKGNLDRHFKYRHAVGPPIKFEYKHLDQENPRVWNY